MTLSKAFWESQQGLVLVTTDGALRFTKAGRAHYAPLLAKYGYALDQVDTVEEFAEVMGRINAEELAANTREFERLLHDPATTPAERALIRQVLRLGPEAEDLPAVAAPAASLH